MPEVDDVRAGFLNKILLTPKVRDEVCLHPAKPKQFKAAGKQQFNVFHAVKLRTNLVHVGQVRSCGETAVFPYSVKCSTSAKVSVADWETWLFALIRLADGSLRSVSFSALQPLPQPLLRSVHVDPKHESIQPSHDLMKLWKAFLQTQHTTPTQSSGSTQVSSRPKRTRNKRKLYTTEEFPLTTRGGGVKRGKGNPVGGDEDPKGADQDLEEADEEEHRGLRGAQGPRGPAGETGKQGTQGPPGITTRQLSADKGHNLSQHLFLTMRV